MKLQIECVKCGKVHRQFVRRCERCGSANVQQLQENEKWQSKKSNKK